jgi:hypothetical protein
MKIRQGIVLVSMWLITLGSGMAHAGLFLDRGRLATDEAGIVTYTLVGYEASHFNVFFAEGDWIFDRADLGKSFDALVAPGALKFSFFDFDAAVWGRNGNRSRVSVTGNGDGTFLLGFDDSRRRRDFDFNDMTVLVGFASAVPEPTMPVLLSGGLGLVGLFARRCRPAGRPA